MFTTFEALPIEIHQRIGTHLSIVGIQSIRGTCKTLSGILGVDQDPWHHLHITIPGEEPMDEMKSYVGACENYCPANASVNEHVCRKGTIKVTKKNIAKFMDELQLGLLDRALLRVRTISVSGCLFLQKKLISFKTPGSKSTSQYYWLLKFLRKKCMVSTVSVACSLETYMVQTENDYTEPDEIIRSCAVLSFLQKVNARKELYLLTDEDSKSIFQTIRHALRGINNISTLQLDGQGCVRYLHFIKKHNQLVPTLKRLDVYNEQPVNVLAFSKWLAKCPLESIYFGPVTASNPTPESANWVPRTTHTLRISESVLPTVIPTRGDAQRTRKVIIDNATGQFFFYFASNASEIHVDWAELAGVDSVLRRGLFAALLPSLRSLTQLHCWNLPAPVLLDFWNDPYHKLISLSLRNIDPIDYSQLLIKFPMLKWLYITVSDVFESLAQLRDHNWTELIFEANRTFEPWLVELDRDKIYDHGYSKVAVYPGRIPYLVDFELTPTPAQ